MTKEALAKMICVLMGLTMLSGCGKDREEAAFADEPAQVRENTQESGKPDATEISDDPEVTEAGSSGSEESENTAKGDLSDEDAARIADGLGGRTAVIERQDYDGDGRNEAFVIRGEKDEFGGTLAEELWFISSDKETQLLRKDFKGLSMYAENDGHYMEYADENKGFFYADFGGYGSGWTTLIYGVKGGKPYELAISMDTEGLYQDTPGKFYTYTDNFDDGHAYLVTPLIYDSKTGQFEKGEPEYEADMADPDTDPSEEGTIPEYLIYVNAPDGYANLRTGPGTEYDIICPLPNGEALEVYREQATDKKGRKWLKVAYYRDEGKVDTDGWITAWIAESQVD